MFQPDINLICLTCLWIPVIVVVGWYSYWKIKEFLFKRRIKRALSLMLKASMPQLLYPYGYVPDSGSIVPTIIWTVIVIGLISLVVGILYDSGVIHWLMSF